MDNPRTVWIVIPAFNEAPIIGLVITSLKQAGYSNILLVDDGSYDQTAQKARKAGAEVLRHIINLGQGAALRTGIEYIVEKENPDVIVTFDADGQHCAEDIAALTVPVLSKNIDVVLGSRFLGSAEKMPWIRKIILKSGVLFTNFISHISLTDTHNGLRALSRKAARRIKITHRGMEHASDIIDEITKNKLTYREVPVRIVYSKYSQSKGQRNSAFFRMGIKIILKKLLS